MSKNITLMGASYPDVPAVVLPQTGGGTATFYDADDGDSMEFGEHTSAIVGSAVVGTATIGLALVGSAIVGTDRI